MTPQQATKEVLEALKTMFSVYAQNNIPITHPYEWTDALTEAALNKESYNDELPDEEEL